MDQVILLTQTVADGRLNPAWLRPVGMVMVECGVRVAMEPHDVLAAIREKVSLHYPEVAVVCACRMECREEALSSLLAGWARLTGDGYALTEEGRKAANDEWRRGFGEPVVG